MSFDIPILIIAWRRPNHLREVLNAISKVEPKYIYAVVDGIREGPNLEEEKILIKQTQEIIKNEIKWNCELKYNFRTENLGCGLGVSEAINWFFEHEEYGIIIEDDIIISVSGLEYLKWGLEKYKNNSEVWVISAWQPYNTLGFTVLQNYFYCWGWATWKRTWNEYRYRLPKNGDLIFKFFFIKKYWNDIFDNISSMDTWDFQLQYWMFINNGKALIPSENYIDNIGFDEWATHTKNNKSSEKFKQSNTKFNKPTYVIKLPRIISDLMDYKSIRNMNFLNLMKILRKLKYWVYRRFNLL